MAEHRFLTGASLHECKGIGTASAGGMIVANGVGGANIVNQKSLDLFPRTQTVFDDFVVPIVAANAAGVSPPSLVKVNDDGAGSTGVYYYGFAHNAIREVFFTIQLPHRYKAGTAIRPHIHWGPTTANTGNVRWGLEYCISNVNQQAALTSIIYGTGAAPGVLRQQVITGFPHIDGTDLRESSLLNCRFFRDATHVSDTYGFSAVAMSFDIHFEVEKLGTVSEWP